ncbi:MAG: hypothetical protein BMS9Abin23_0192 [Thermodesulfobacteriota bacterium]|nr:MAG: hypothetical protein BMS9Abin23_0192 [Thermodesulfobacteriota bacterium]
MAGGSLCGYFTARMRLMKGPFLIMAAVMMLWANSSEGGNPGDLVSGKKIYQKYCHFCHGRSGMGDGPIGIAITPKPVDFVHDRKRMSKPDEKLFESITNGIRKEIGGKEMAMPAWGGILSEKERWDVLKYVRELERKGLEAEKKAGGK